MRPGWIYLFLCVAGFLLGACTHPPHQRLDQRYRFKDQPFAFPERTQLDTGAVYVHSYVMDPDSTQVGYEFYRFDHRGQAWRHQAFSREALAGAVNEFKQGHRGYYQISGDTLVIELWINRYSNFVYFEGFVTDRELVLERSRPRGFWKARDNIHLEYQRQSFSGLEPLPDW